MLGVIAALWVPGSLGDVCARLSLVIRTSTSGGREMVAGRSDMPKARQDVGSAADTGTWWDCAPCLHCQGLPSWGQEECEGYKEACFLWDGLQREKEEGETGEDASPLMGFSEKVCVRNSNEQKKRENLSGNNRNYLLDFLG